MRIGSLFSGFGGLDMAVSEHYGASVAWHVEFDKHPSKVLAHHYPDVPNFGDVTSVDWRQVEPVDIITGGFPCQDVSHAGLRRGVHQGTRSGLWFEMVRAIDALRPQKVVIENVLGLLSASAAGDVEPCPWCLGDESASPLRALGAVLADLAALPNKDGRPRLSARFVEFMMGLPEGWVTDVDIPRSAQLKCLGNGVVKQQALLALSLLDGAR